MTGRRPAFDPIHATLTLAGLTGEDEVGTHRQLTAALDLISKRIKDAGGRVVHYAGDAVLADFDSVVAAVKAAVFAPSQANCGPVTGRPPYPA